MIILQAYEVTTNLRGKKTTKTGATLIKKWENDYPFDFHVQDPEGWRIFLKNYEQNGYKLPRKMPNGAPIVYRCYMWGCPKDFVQPLKSGQRVNYYNLFPGYDERGVVKDIIKHGSLQ